jgi:hypothetical protein
MAKSPEEMIESMIANFKENTGKTLDQWIQIARALKLDKHGAIVKQLKAEHGIGHGYANMVAQRTLQGDAPAASGDDLVDAQYAGTKAALQPIYDKLIGAVKHFGGDVEISPKKTYVSLRRNKQFALIQPTTATRVDVGINLKGTPTTARLEAAGSFNAMVSHRVRVASPSEVDQELVGWLKQAYAGA